MDFEYQGKVIRIVQSDITTVKVDAIVNAANEGLRGGGGVDGAIHRAGGPAIMEECRKIGRCVTGNAVLTSGGSLPAKYVIHAVGPVWQGGKSAEADFLRRAYDNSLNLAAKQELKSIAFPSISTGVYGFPIEEACPIAINTVLNHLDKKTSLKEVQFVLFTRNDYDLYVEETGTILRTRG
jgi:O-acetyl-ADP-ribose deacetylase (regulator of RNase III)